MINAGDLARVVLDSASPASDRSQAAVQLVDVDATAARVALIEVASRSTEATEILHWAGRELGKLASVHGHLTEWELRDVQEAAFDEYGEWYR